MNRPIHWRRSLGITLLLGTASVLPIQALAVPAQTSPEVQKSTLDEVVVTARKRVENAEKVPISMSVASGQLMVSQGVTNLQELAPSVPNFNFTQTVAAADQYFIRGFGSGVNAGFEMAVGTVIDGFFYGRSRYGRAAFLDVSQVEVLKGPQGALIGKNTSAGAINIITNTPTKTLEANLNAGWEFAGDPGYAVTGAVSGPLTERLHGRVAFSYDHKDGWVDNLAVGGKQPKTKDFSQRTTLDLDATDNLLVRLSYQYGHMHDPGRNEEISKCSSGFQSIIATNGLSGVEDCKFNYTSSIGVVNANNVQREDQHNTSFNNVNLTAKWTGDAFTITSLTGYSGYNALDDWDSDNSALQLTSYIWGEKYNQWTQELRVASNQGKYFDYIAGIYLAADDQKDNQQLSFYPALVPSALSGSRNSISTQITHTVAGFAQADVHITKQLDLTLGGRYTHETKKAHHNEFPTQILTDIPITLPGGPAAAAHDVYLNRSENNFSPNGSLQWHPNEDSMVYANISRGFKGGGYDLQFSGNQAAAEANMEFAGETVTAYELGGKFTFDHNRAQFNVDVFREDFKNLQVSALLSQANLTFAVGNAAAARSQGVEADFRYRPLPGLTLSASGAYLDAKFTNFPGAQCWTGQTETLGCTGSVQDLSGHPLQFAPKWAGTLNADYVAMISNSYSLDMSAQLVYKSLQYLALSNDPNLTQSAYAKINGQIALNNDQSFWTIALIGRNLTNKMTAPFGNSANSIGGNGTYFEFSDPPREVEIQARLHL